MKSSSEVIGILGTGSWLEVIGYRKVSKWQRFLSECRNSDTSKSDEFPSDSIGWDWSGLLSVVLYSVLFVSVHIHSHYHIDHRVFLSTTLIIILFVLSLISIFTFRTEQGVLSIIFFSPLLSSYTYRYPLRLLERTMPFSPFQDYSFSFISFQILLRLPLQLLEMNIFFQLLHS